MSDANRYEHDEWDQAFLDAGYIFCRPDQEWHRPPECPINEQGESNPTWEDAPDDETCEHTHKAP